MDIDDEQTRKSFLGVIDSEADRMTRLVKDLLALSQLDNSKTAFDFRPTDVQELISGIVKTMVMDAKKNKILLAYIPSGSGSEEIYVDKDRISQVIVNIISNAIKYTPEGGSVTVLSGQQEKYAYIKVTDTGIGIPEKDLPMIFERFYRVDKARSRQQGGTGLGLAIAKEIVEAHKGQISIESVYGSGTTVTVRLPLENPEERVLENG
jgi:two-component system sensor histidine kinase VicK